MRPSPEAFLARLGRRRQLTLAATLGTAALAVLAVGAGIVCPAGACAAPALDTRLLALANDWRERGFDTGLAAVSWLGSLFVLLPAALWLGWRQWRAAGGRQALFLPFAVASAALLAALSKMAVARPRPELFAPLIDLPPDASFPSGHAVQASAFALAWLCRPGARVAAAEAGALILLAGLVGVSRIHLQVHFPSDVLFGCLAAVLWVLALRCLPVWQGPQR